MHNLNDKIPSSIKHLFGQKSYVRISRGLFIPHLAIEFEARGDEQKTAIFIETG